MEHNNYFLGLDMGTSSVGWAITDSEYNLIRKKGKDLWGIREFDEAKTAAERRSFRVSRRRRQREKVRINLIRSYFAEAIEAVDPAFFHRLDNSKYYLEDKDPDVRTPNGVFNDSDYKDKDFYAQYPTIFHLRKELIENHNAPYDVRLVYLAIANMFKHRGHFLNAELSDDGEIINIEKAYEAFVKAAAEVIGSDFTCDNTESLSDILSDRGLSKTRKTEKLQELLNIDKKKKAMTECCKALCGRTVDAAKIFTEEDIEEKASFSFADYTEETEEVLIKSLGDDRYGLIEAMKNVYDASLLSEILGGYEYLSFARVAAYEKHKNDLRILKSCVRQFGTEEQYDTMFRSDAPGTYSAYVNSTNSGKLRRRDMKSRKQSDFYDFVKKQIKGYHDSDYKQYILDEIDKESFMPKQLTASNGVIPNQVHVRELRRILGNASNYLHFLNDTDESGLTIAQRIIKLFSFQIPYYVGPVTERSEAAGGNGWVIRKESGAILPWNIEDKIDMDATRRRFISKLIRDCTYLSGEKVLPKSSLLYQKYCVLNEINNLRIDNEKIPVNLKQDIYNDLFKCGKKATLNQIFEYLRIRGFVTEKEQISGVDKNINNNLTSYGKCKSVLGEVVDTDTGRSMVEEIINLCTVYGDSRRFLKEQLTKKYSELTDKQIDRLIGLKFKDWGRLSKAFLEIEGVEKGTGEVRTIIGALWETNCNLMELLSEDKFTYKQAIEERQTTLISSLADITPDILDDYYFSAPVKKMINQTMKIIKEAEKIMGGPPSRVFIEMTRSDEEKGDQGRKDSRKKQLLDLYKSIKDDTRDWAAQIESEDQSGRLKSKKMYLYITQMGRDMYTGKPIELKDLFNDNLYDIDHIYPRHFVKDDSLHNNLVLVNKGSNAHKSDEYPLESSIRNNPVVAAHWKHLKDVGLITEEKYHRLISNNKFTDEQKADFIARQLVETGQGTKGVADFLRQALPETTIVYSKASNVSDFRNKYGLVKSRLVNDFHHANDAYLNIVVGNVYYTKFTQNPRNYIKKEYRQGGINEEYNLSKMFDRDVKRNGETAWIASSSESTGTIATVKKVMGKNTPLMTRQSFCGHGGIADQTLYSKNKAKGNGYIPLKTSNDEKLQDVTRYGGFSKASTAYFCLVEYTDRKKIVRSLEAVPIYLLPQIEKDPSSLERYIMKQNGLKEVSIRLRKIPLQSLLRVNGYDVHLSGRTGDQLVFRNAVNLCLAPEWVSYIKMLDNYKQTGQIPNALSKDINVSLYDQLLIKHTDGIYTRRPNSIGDKLRQRRDLFITLSVEKQCETLLQILRLSAIGADSKADLSNLNYSENTGTMKISKKISSCKQCLLINQSPMGVTGGLIDLLNI